MSIENLKEQIKRVAELREKVKETEQERDSLEAQVSLTSLGRAYQTSIINLKVEKEILAQTEDELKAAAVALYQETGEKKPIDKVEIKIFKELDYDPKEVETWCRTFSPAMLTLDKKAFEKVAENLTDAPVIVNEIPKCTLGTDLSQYLEEKKWVDNARDSVI